MLRKDDNPKSLRHSGEPEASAELGGGFAVAEETEGAKVVEVALAAAFGYGTNVISIPQAAPGGDGLHAVEMEAGCTGWGAGSLECVVGGDGVDVADCADAVIAGEDLVAEIAGIGSKAPLVNAVVGAEGAAAFGNDFKVAPTAEGELVGA